MYQMLNYDSLSKTQKLSIKSTEILLNLCSYESKYFLNYIILFEKNLNLFTLKYIYNTSISN